MLLLVLSTGLLFQTRFYNNGTWTEAAAGAGGYYNTQGQWFQTLGTKMQKLSNKIHQLTLRGGANFMVLFLQLLLLSLNQSLDSLQILMVMLRQDGICIWRSESWSIEQPLYCLQEPIHD
jgi:hypothetical protein